MKKLKVLTLILALTVIFTVVLQPLQVLSESGSHETSTNEGMRGHYGSGGSGDSKTELGKGHYGQGGAGSSGSGESHSEEEPHEGSEGSGHKGGTGSSGNKGGSGGASGSGSGRRGEGGGKPSVTKGSVILNVEIEWPEGSDHPNEVEVTLVGSDSADTVTTVNGEATFYTEPGDEWELIGEAVPGFTVPRVGVAIKGTDEEVSKVLTYKIATDIPVTSIELNKTSLQIFTGESVQLTAKVLPLNAIQEVGWKSSDNSIVRIDEDGLLTALSPGEAKITAKAMDGFEAYCTVEVLSSEEAITVTGITLNETQVTLTLGAKDNDEFQLIASISPVEAAIKDVIWTSGNKDVATVDERGLVTAVSPGATIITATTVDGGFQAFARISVSVAAEIEYIYPTLEFGVEAEHFNSPDEVYINVENLVNKLIEDNIMTEDGVKYYVKVTEKGSTEPLNSKSIDESIIYLYRDTTEFWLRGVTGFRDTDNFSNRYFVYMSQYDDFPKDDEKTLMTNFMGGTTTPTIPKENINVYVEMYGGNRSVEGIYFILAREDYEGALKDVIWRDFYIDGSENSPEDPYDPENGVGKSDWVDEVKVIGKTNAEGFVEWFEPRETIKLGGYLLLEVTPLGYEDNLNDPDTSSDDGDLLKQVHLKRDGYIDRVVQNVYVGGPQEQQVEYQDEAMNEIEYNVMATLITRTELFTMLSKCLDIE